MKKIISIAIISTALLMSGSAFAGDANAGKGKSSMCAGCHGMNGVSSNPGYPNLAGQKQQYLVKALKAYKSGARKDATMSSFVSSLSDADIENLAAYYSSLK
jgi:cytochrome c553